MRRWVGYGGLVEVFFGIIEIVSFFIMVFKGFGSLILKKLGKWNEEN